MNRRSRDYPLHNRLLVYTGIAIVGAAVFPPSMLVTAPTIVGWYRGARRQEFTARQAVLNDIAQRDYDKAVRGFHS